jgi:hypothetical protein
MEIRAARRRVRDNTAYPVLRAVLNVSIWMNWIFWPFVIAIVMYGIFGGYKIESADAGIVLVMCPSEIIVCSLARALLDIADCAIQNAKGNAENPFEL